jgi:hypothetical protein
MKNKWYKPIVGLIGVCFLLTLVSPAFAVEIGDALAGESGMIRRIVKGFEKSMTGF